MGALAPAVASGRLPPRAGRTVRQVAAALVATAPPVRGASGEVDGMLRLRDARASQGLTVDALAARAGVSDATIYRIERGATTPRTNIARRLSAALGLPLTEVAEFSAVAERTRLGGARPPRARRSRHPNRLEPGR
jgi:DNA-binding XRE family transcriptional regulator